MTFNEFIFRYPCVDLVMGFAPVLVAILAIIINNWRSGVRDKKNKKIDIIINYESMLIEKISKTDRMLDELRESFEGVMQSTNLERSIKYLEKYNYIKGEMLNYNVELFNFCFSASDILYENVDAKDIAADIRSVIKHMNEMVEKRIYEQNFNEISEEDLKKIREIKDEVIEIKSWMQLDVKRIMNKILSMLN